MGEVEITPTPLPEEQADETTSDSLQGLIKLAVDLRLILLLVAMGAALLQGAERSVLVLMLLASYASIGVLLWWDRIAQALLRYPALFLIDIAITMTILLTAGFDGPFVLYTVSTAFLAGALYGYVGGWIFGLALAVAVGLLAAESSTGMPSFITLVGMPVMIAVCGVGAASIRTLLLRSADMEATLDSATEQAAGAEERARLAREMHDTLGKTLHGIALSAAALPRWLEKRPSEAAAKATQLAAAAQTAAQEARQLIGDLRSDSMEKPLHLAIIDWVREWSAGSGVEVSLAVTTVGVISSSARYELFTILREALRNVDAHSGATRASVFLAESVGRAILEVADNGHGVPTTDLDALAADGHYGLVGMNERAARAGGGLTITSDNRGTTIRAEVPMRSAHDMVPISEDVS